MDGTESVLILFTDARGHVTYQLPGAAAGEAADRHVRGQTWRDVLQGVVKAQWLPSKLPEKETFYAADSRDGRRVGIRVSPLPPDSPVANVIVLEKPSPPLSSHVQRLCTVGKLAAGAAHEMNNLLTVMSGWLELVLADECLASENRESLEKVAEVTDQLTGLSNSLLDLTRTQADQAERVDLNRLVQQVLALVHYQLQKNNIGVRSELTEEPLVVRGNRGDLSQVLLNLIMNAGQAMPAGGNLGLSTRREDEKAVVEVRDNGCGIPHEIREQVFAPFFTTRWGEGGTGLGLPVCSEIVARHGGELHLDSEPGAGTIVTLRMVMLKESVAVAGK